MAATPGKTGALFFRKAKIQATTLALVDGGGGSDTITDSGNGLVTAGFENGDIIIVSGATDSNDNVTVTLTGVAAGTLTFATGTFTTGEGAGALITVQEAKPGTQVLLFSNWSLDIGVDMLDVTSFEDVGIEKMIAGIRRWTATADKFMETSQLTPENWISDEILVRFFYRYDAAPNVTTVWYLEGNCFVNGIAPSAPVEGVVTETITFTGSAKASISGTGIAFVDGGGGADTITDTGSGFLTAGFEEGDKITVTGSTSNDGDYTIVSVVAGTITLATGVLTTEGAAALVSIAAEVRLTTRTTAWPT